MFHLFLFLVILPLFVRTDIVDKYVEALKKREQSQLFEVLNENFTIINCKGEILGDRDDVWGKLQEMPFKIPTRKYQTIKLDNGNFKVNTTAKTEDEFRMENNTLIIIKKTKCYYGLIPLLDYNKTFQEFSKIVVKEYGKALAKKDNLTESLENVLDETFLLFPCGFRRFTRQIMISELEKIREGIVTNYIDLPIRIEMSNEIVEFRVNSTKFKAKYFEETGKFRIIREIETNCAFPPFLTSFIGDLKTARKIAQNSIDMYSKAMNETNLEAFEKLSKESIEIYSCKKRNGTLITPEFYLEKCRDIWKDFGKPVEFVETLTQGIVSFSVFADPKKSLYPKLTFLIDLPEKNVQFNVDNDSC